MYVGGLELRTARRGKIADNLLHISSQVGEDVIHAKYGVCSQLTICKMLPVCSGHAHVRKDTLLSRTVCDRKLCGGLGMRLQQK